MSHRRSRGLRFAPLILVGFFCCAVWPGAASPVAVPPLLARADGFTGRIVYSGHRFDISGSPEVRGIVDIGDGHYTLEERTPNYVLRADDAGAIVRFHGTQARASSVLDVDALVNSWAIAVAALARGDLLPRGRGAWQTGDGIILYLDADGAVVAGMTVGRGGRLAFTFSRWADAGGLAFPKRILRLRRGIADASFEIDRVDVIRGLVRAAGVNVAEEPAAENAVPPPLAAGASAQASAPQSPPFPWRLMLTAFGLMLLGVAVVAWLYRDAFAVRLCRQRAVDPRAWRGVQSAAYVNADGVLSFEGNDYRVGTEFFARCVEVQCSALFVRVSAPGLARAIVMPRRLPRLSANRRTAKRRAAAHGLSLIETLAAVAFFAVVIVGAVYPALVAVARADFVAAQKRAALVAAANALTDEEAACAYGQAEPTGTMSTVVNGMTVVVTVTDEAVPGARDIVVTSSDASGRVLATLATTVGPPVPPPNLGGAPDPGGPPRGGPPSQTPAPTPTPNATATPSSSWGDN